MYEYVIVGIFQLFHMVFMIIIKKGVVYTTPFFCILKIRTINYISVQLLKSAEPSAVVGALGRDAAVPSIQKIF